MPGNFLSSKSDLSLEAAFGVTGLNNVTTFGEATAANFNLMRREGLSDSYLRAPAKYVDERVKLYEEQTGENGAFLRQWYPTAKPHREKVNSLISRGELILDNNKIVATSQEAQLYLGMNEQQVRAGLVIRQMSEKNPGLFLNDSEVSTRVAEDFRIQREKDQSVIARSESRIAPALVGTAGAVLTDPLVLMTLPLGAQTILGEMLVGVAIEIPIQAETYRFKNEIGSEFTFADAAFNVLSAGIGAGVLRGVGGLTVKGVKSLLAKADEVKLQRAFTAVEEQAQSRLQAVLHVLENNPLDDYDAHIRAWEKAVIDVESYRPVRTEGITDGFTSPIATSGSLDELTARLIADSGTVLSRGDRINLEREAVDLAFKIEERSKDLTYTKPPPKGISASEKKKIVNQRKVDKKAADAEIGDLKSQLKVVEKRLEGHKKAAEANKTLTRIEEMKKNRVPVADIEKTVGIVPKPPEKAPVGRPAQQIVKDILNTLKSEDVPVKQLRELLASEQGIKDVAKRAGLSEEDTGVLLGAIQGRGAQNISPVAPKGSVKGEKISDDIDPEEVASDVALADRLVAEENPDLPVQMMTKDGETVLETRKASEVFSEIRARKEALDVVEKCNT